MTCLERQPLTRIDPAADDTIDPVVAELAMDAQKVLGYRLLADKVRESKHNARKIQAPIDLVNALSDLGIKPFSSSSVSAYRVQKCKEENEPPKLGGYLLSWLVLLACILSVAFVIGYFRMGMSVPSLPHLLRGAFYITVIVTIVSMLGFYLGPGWGWLSIPLDEYRNPVPIHVLKKAMAIRTKVPEAQFFVETITSNYLLRVECGECFYIEVWDDPHS